MTMDEKGPGESVEAIAANRRSHDRVDGPFDGHRVTALELPVRIGNLSEGGCFVNSMFEQVSGARLQLTIDLPNEGSITLQGEALYYRPDFGFAVRFTEMTEQTRARLEDALRKLRESA